MTPRRYILLGTQEGVLGVLDGGGGGVAMNFLQPSSLVSIHSIRIGDATFPAQDLVAETPTAPEVPLRIPTRLTANIQCGTINREAIEHLMGDAKPAPIEMTFTHRLVPWAPLSRSARRQKRMPFAKRRALRRAKRRHVVHNVRRALQGKQLLPAPLPGSLNVRLYRAEVRQAEGDQWGVLSMELRAVAP